MTQQMSELAARRRQEEIRQSTDILARLLAIENLTIIDGGVTTSCIDLKHRIVRIVKFPPDSPLATKQVRMTSIAHEVGHAVFTPTNLMHGNVDKKYPRLHVYINIVEDIRIEKLIKNKYMGLHSLMKEGRAIMYRNGVFGEDALEFPNNIAFINKVILYSKVGVEETGLQLTTTDEAVIKYIERMAIDEPSVVKCAKFLYEYCKERDNPSKVEHDIVYNPNAIPDDGELSNLISKLLERAEKLREDDVEKTETIENTMEQNFSENADTENVTSTLRKDTFAKHIIKQYTPTVTVRNYKAPKP